MGAVVSGLAADLAAEADELMARRKVLLVASVALSTTNSPAAAIASIRTAGLPGSTGAQAADLIRSLATALEDP